MKILTGLGNPGAEHARHRHNVGFMALDAIAGRHGIGPLRRRFHGAAAEGRIGAEKVLLLKPLTYMNESGRSVSEAAHFYKVGPANIIVLHDEIDLAPGKVRVKRGGGVAGHNGLRSLAAHFGPDFVRVRIGIGHPGAKHLVHRHVLGDFAKADRTWLEPLLEAIARNAERLVEGDNSNFMNEVARALQNEDAAPPSATGSKRAHDERAKTPSQRDLARAAAEGSKQKAGSEPPALKPGAEEAGGGEAPSGSGPFARLRRLLAGARDPSGR